MKRFSKDMPKGKRGAPSRIQGHPRDYAAVKRGALALILGAAVCVGTGFCVPLLSMKLLERLFPVWGIDENTFAYAPGLLQLLYANPLPFYGILMGAVLWAIAAALGRFLLAERRFWRGDARKVLVFGGMGALAVCAMALILRLGDAVRFAYSLLRPEIGLETVWIILYFLVTAIGEEAFLRGFLPGFIAPHIRPLYTCAALTAVSAALAALGGTGGYALVNCALMAVLLYQMLLLTGSIWPGAAFRFTWDFFACGVLGMPGGYVAGLRAIYETYTVSSEWLTGGALGLNGGALATLVLLALVAVLGVKLRPAKGS